MAARTERDTLNGLIDISRDAGRGFRVAAERVEDPELQRLFGDAARQHDLFAAELLPYAGWMKLMSATSSRDERAMLAEAQRGERAIMRAYRDAINNILPPNARPVIERQYREIRSVQQELFELALPCA
jgi:hypothetical protein